MNLSLLSGLKGAPSRIFRLFVASFLSLGCTAVGVRGQDFVEGRVVSRVDVRIVEWKAASRVQVRAMAANKSVDEAHLHSFISMHRGQIYHGDDMEKDVKALYESGMIEDVRVLAEPAGETVKLRYEVETCGPMR